MLTRSRSHVAIVGTRLHRYRTTCKTKRKCFLSHLHVAKIIKQTNKHKTKSRNEARNTSLQPELALLYKRLLYNLQLNFSI